MQYPNDLLFGVAPQLLNSIRILIVIFISSMYLYAQPTLGFEKNFSNTYEYSDNNFAQVHTVKIEGTGTNGAGGGATVVTISVHASSSATENKDFYIQKNTFDIAASDAVKDITISIIVLGDKTIEPTESIILNLSVTGGTVTVPAGKSIHVITLDESDDNKSPGPHYGLGIFEPEYRIDIGSNFDFLSGANLKGVYADASVFFPDAISLGNVDNPNRYWRNIGFLAGLRQSRPLGDSTIAGTSVQSSQRVIERLTSNNETVIERQYYNVGIENSKYTNTTVYLNPIYPISRNEKSVVYGVLDISMTRRRYVTNYSIDTIGPPDTLILRGDRASTRFFNVPTKPANITSYDFLAGAGLSVRTRIGKNINVILNPSVGYAYSDVTPNFYARTYFNLIELKSGINFGGEVLGFIKGKQNGRNLEPSLYPAINIFVSKAFNLEKIASFK